jgi:hypothetical protein
MLVTARTLGLHHKFEIIFNALDQIAESFGEPVDF